MRKIKPVVFDEDLELVRLCGYVPLLPEAQWPRYMKKVQKFMKVARARDIFDNFMECVDDGMLSSQEQLWATRYAAGYVLAIASLKHEFSKEMQVQVIERSAKAYVRTCKLLSLPENELHSLLLTELTQAVSEECPVRWNDSTYRAAHVVFSGPLELDPPQNNSFDTVVQLPAEKYVEIATPVYEIFASFSEWLHLGGILVPSENGDVGTYVVDAKTNGYRRCVIFRAQVFK